MENFDNYSANILMNQLHLIENTINTESNVTFKTFTINIHNSDHFNRFYKWG